MPTTPTPNDHALMALLNPAPIIMCVGLALDLDEQMQMNREHLQTTIHNEVHNNRRRRRRRRRRNPLMITKKIMKPSAKRKIGIMRGHTDASLMQPML
jgi:hypothetical protein